MRSLSPACWPHFADFNSSPTCQASALRLAPDTVIGPLLNDLCPPACRTLSCSESRWANTGGIRPFPTSCHAPTFPQQAGTDSSGPGPFPWQNRTFGPLQLRLRPSCTLLPAVNSAVLSTPLFSSSIPSFRFRLWVFPLTSLKCLSYLKLLDTFTSTLIFDRDFSVCMPCRETRGFLSYIFL